MKTLPLSPSRAQRGVGLVEVMIALTIGLVLLLGVSQYFISMRRTASSAQQLSALQNQQRMAMYFLHAAVAGAGNVPDPANYPAETLYPSNANFPTAGQSLYGIGTSTTATLRTRFRASGSQQGCSATLTPNVVYTDEFSVTSDGFLTCVETNESTNTSTTVKLVGDPVNKIMGMTILYSVEVANTVQSIVPLSAQQYLRADQMTTALWPSVMAVEITLQFLDPMAGQFGQSSTAVKSLKETIPYMGNV